jgi:hypothetical protein
VKERLAKLGAQAIGSTPQHQGCRHEGGMTSAPIVSDVDA